MGACDVVEGVKCALRFEYCNNDLNKITFFRDDGYAAGNVKRQFSNTENLLLNYLGKGRVQRFPQKQSYREYKEYSIRHYSEDRFDNDIVEMSIKFKKRAVKHQV